MMGTVRSELTRLTRKGFVFGWLGITSVFTALVISFVFSAAGKGGDAPTDGPGVAFPTVAELQSPSGFGAALGATVTLLGVVSLAFWAIAAASDYSSGLIRLLVQAQPRRGRLLLGKVGALALCTAVVTTVATVATLVVAPAVAQSAGIDIESWRQSAGTTILAAWVNTYLALLVWGVVGLVLATITRSSAMAISIGVGYVLIFENFIGLVAEGAKAWLPGGVLTALAQGGTADMTYATAIVLGTLYGSVAIVGTWLIFRGRNIAD